MRYLIFICGDDALERTPEEGAAMGRDTVAWVEEMTAAASGSRATGCGRRPTRPRCASATARCCITDGPFAETKEQIGGFDLLECTDLDEAIEVAAKIPGAPHGTIEVRPIWDDVTRPDRTADVEAAVATRSARSGDGSSRR